MEKPWVWIGVPVVLAVLALLVLGLTGDAPRTTKSGLLITVVKEGSGREAQRGDVVEVHYTGTLKDGKVFNSSRSRGEPIAFELGSGQVIKGWDEGIVGMKVGEQRKLVIPPELAYGKMSKGGIPANSELHFDVELVRIK